MKVESAIRPLDTEHADTEWEAVNCVLRKSKPSKPNITKEMRHALKILKEDDTILVPTLGKGCASAVLDIDGYHSKMLALIETGAYQLLDKSPLMRSYGRTVIT